jgi:hypothetical protein
VCIYVYYKVLGSYVPSPLSTFPRGFRNSELVALIVEFGGAEGGQSMHRATIRPLHRDNSLRPSTHMASLCMTTHAYLCILLPHFTIILESIFSMVGWALVRRQAPSCIMHVRMMAGEVEGRGLGEGGEEGMAEGEGGGMGEGG